ncbi:hypothetical protein CK203_053942 [Vitis vinifera]|uniref:DUF4283 domain-containing protein n=1 Tax=Vitis vinifera TaxID=29760 RepID=A0A438H852_VITVI|nr:hypothetical protein CK203_053942 [Vitis vinifera]
MEEKWVELKTYADAVRKAREGSWALKHWALKGNLRVATLGRGLLLFDFKLPDEAERVLARGLRNFKENVIVLERWNPEVGVSLIGDECGGFIAADKSPLHEMQWARLLVTCVDRELPSTAHIVVGVGLLFPSTLVGVFPLVHTSGACGMFQRGGSSRKEKRLVEQFVISEVEVKGEGGAVEVAAGRECRVSLWRRFYPLSRW